MRGISGACCAVAAAMLVGATTQVGAAPFAYEAFNYTVGANLKDQPGWTEPGGPEDTTLDKIRAGSLFMPGRFDSGNSLRTGGKYSFDSFIVADTPVDNPTNFIGGDGNTFWFSFRLQRENLGNGGTVNPDYGGLVLGSDANDVNNLFIGKPGAGATDKYAIEALNGTAQQASAVSEVLGTTAFLAVRITFHGGAAEDISLFVNPAPGATEASLVANATTQVELNAFNDFSFSSGVNSNWIFDELLMGTSFADVSPVPEPTAIVLLVAAPIGLLSRRRR
jgi:hypothetical protein